MGTINMGIKMVFQQLLPLWSHQIEGLLLAIGKQFDV
jgi:hypothetical protein